MARLYHRFTSFDKKFGRDVLGWKITHKGIFSKEYLYWMLHDWFVTNKWGDNDARFGETFYEQIESSIGQQIQIRWLLTKTAWPDRDFKAHMDVLILMIGVQDTEAVVDGKKVKAQKGEVSIEIKPRMVYAAGEKWDSPLKKFKIAGKDLEEYWYKSMYKVVVDKVEEKIMEDVFALQAALKSYFQIAPSAEYGAMYKTKVE